MDLQRLTIGQMAQLNDISEQTLRLYDKEGLLKAQEVDLKSGYRYYHILQSARLDLIQNLKMYGLTLKQIKDILNSNHIDAIKNQLEYQETEIDIRIDQLSHARNTLKRVLDNYKRYEALPKNGEIFLEYQNERHIYTLNCEQDFFEQDESGYEYMLRQLKRHLVSQDIPLSFFYNIGTVIRKERLEKEEIFSDEVFFFVDGNGFHGQCEAVPAATYVCICSDDFADEEENANRLLQYIKEMGYQIAGDYLCEAVIDFPVLEATKRHIFSKIQIPVFFA